MTRLKLQESIIAISDCAVKCLQCASADLNEKDTKMMAHCIKIDHECAAICFLTMQAIAGDSVFIKQILSLCAEICNACADECEKHTHMQHCKICAEACRKCAESCLAI